MGLLISSLNFAAVGKNWVNAREREENLIDLTVCAVKHSTVDICSEMF